MVSIQFLVCSRHLSSPRPGMRNGIRTLGNQRCMLQPRNVICQGGQSSVFPEGCFTESCASQALTPLCLGDGLKAESSMRPWDRKYFKLILSHLSVWRGRPQFLHTHYHQWKMSSCVLKKEFLETRTGGCGSVVNFQGGSPLHHVPCTIKGVLLLTPQCLIPFCSLFPAKHQ